MEQADRDQIAANSRAEILYILGMIEAKLEHNSNAWIEPLKKIEHTLDKLDNKIDRDIVTVKVDVIQNREKIEDLDNKLSTLQTTFRTSIAAIVVVWAVFGNTVSSWLDKVIL